MEHSRFENLNKNIYNFCDNLLENKKGYDALKVSLIGIYQI